MPATSSSTPTSAPSTPHCWTAGWAATARPYLAQSGITSRNWKPGAEEHVVRVCLRDQAIGLVPAGGIGEDAAAGDQIGLDVRVCLARIGSSGVYGLCIPFSCNLRAEHLVVHLAGSEERNAVEMPDLVEPHDASKAFLEQ